MEVHETILLQKRSQTPTRAMGSRQLPWDFPPAMSSTPCSITWADLQWKLPCSRLCYAELLTSIVQSLVNIALHPIALRLNTTPPLATHPAVQRPQGKRQRQYTGIFPSVVKYAPEYFRTSPSGCWSTLSSTGLPQTLAVTVA